MILRVLCKIISHDVLGETQSSSEMELIPIIPTRDHVIAPGLECSLILILTSRLMNHNERSETQKRQDIQRVRDVIRSIDSEREQIDILIM